MPTTGARDSIGRISRAAPARTALRALLALSLLACGGGGAGTPDAPYVITIQANTFEPTRLEVPAGATVVVLNRDPWLHTVTSEAAPGALAYGTVAGVGFDTGAFTGSQAFTLPASAPAGTVIPYFCQQLRAAMLDQGEVVVMAGAGALPRTLGEAAGPDGARAPP